MRRIVAILILLCCVFTASCSSVTPLTESESILTEDNNGETTAFDPLSDREKVPDGLPERDFSGESYIIVTDTYQEFFYYSPDLNGDIINDTIYRRNADVEERFNVKIRVIAFPYPEAVPFMTNSVLAGEDSFTLCAMQAIMAGGLVLNDLFINWRQIEYLDFDKPWWSKSTTEDLEYNGTIMFAVGDLALGAMTNTYCMFYDKVAAENYNVGDIYSVVREGGWTIDVLDKTVKGIYSDLNGNGERDIEDYYGLSTPIRSDANAYLWAFDNPIFKRGPSGELEYVFKTEKLNGIVDKLRGFLYDNPGVFTTESYNNPNEKIQEMSRDLFMTGHTLFANGYIEMAATHFRGLENEYGIIPYPKWNEAQERYLTMTDGNFAGLSVPKTVSSLDMAGMITEALCAETWKNVYPAYYETALKIKFMRDEESVAMLDLIIDSRVFDFGYVYDNWKGIAFDLQRILQNRTQEFESYYASKESAVLKYYDEVIEYFESH